MRPVRSPRTALILLLLREAPRTARELAEYLGLWPSEVHAYLHALRRRGVVEHDDGVWFLTDYGNDYLDNIRNHVNVILRSSEYGINNNKQELTTINFIPKLEARIKEWAGDAYNDCQDVVSLFLKLRERGTYVELPRERALETLWELAQELGISSIDTGKLQECIQDLRARGVLYVYQRGGLVKIRLNRRLEEQASAQAPHTSSPDN